MKNALRPKQLVSIFRESDAISPGLGISFRSNERDHGGKIGGGCAPPVQGRDVPNLRGLVFFAPLLLFQRGPRRVARLSCPPPDFISSTCTHARNLPSPRRWLSHDKAVALARPARARSIITIHATHRPRQMPTYFLITRIMRITAIPAAINAT